MEEITGLRNHSKKLLVILFKTTCGRITSNLSKVLNSLNHYLDNKVDILSIYLYFDTDSRTWDLFCFSAGR